MKRLFCFALTAALAFPAPAYTLPEGGTASSGSASFERTDANTLRITTSDKAVINYDSFNIGQSETVRFLQPSSSSVALNRVTGGDPSQILGSLYANGKVFLLNPNGIFFGPGCVIDTGSFIASTLEMKDADFLSGNYKFELKEGAAPSYIINQGTIKVSPEGYAVLVSPLVSNEGMIIAQSGNIAVGGTSKAAVSFDDKGLLNFSVSGLDRQPGTVLVPQSLATQLIKDVVNCDTLVVAGDVIEEGGVVKLVGAEGVAINAGTMSVNGSEGKDAGRIILNAARATAFTPTGRLEAKGFGLNSNGGFAEVSSKGLFSIAGVVDLTAQYGKTGTLLIDPYDVTIAGANTNGSWSGGEFTPTGTATILETTLEDYLNAADVIVMTSGAGTDPGEIYVDADIDYAGLNYRTLTLIADGGINLRNGGINFTGNAALNLSANGGGILIGRPITATSITMTSAGDITLNQNITATAGELSIVAGGAFSAGVNSCITGAGDGTTVGITGQNGLTLGGATLALGRKQLVQTGSGGVTLGSANGSDISLGYNAISIDQGLLNINTGGPDQGAIISTFDGQNILADGDVTLAGNGVGTTAAPLTIAGDSSGDSVLGVSSGCGELGLTIKTDQFRRIDVTQDSISNIDISMPGGDAIAMTTGGEMNPQLAVDTHMFNNDFGYTCNDMGITQIDLLGLNTGSGNASFNIYSTLHSLSDPGNPSVGKVTTNQLSFTSYLGGLDLNNADNRISNLGLIEAYGGDANISNNCPLTLHDDIYASYEDDSYAFNILIDNHNNPVDFSPDCLGGAYGWWSNNGTIIASDITNLQNAYFDYVYNKLTLQPYSASSTIGLGGAAGDSGAAFEIDQAELDELYNDFYGYDLEIGHPDGTGALLLGGDVTFSSSNFTYTVHSGRVNDTVNTIYASDTNNVVFDLNSNSGANALRLAATSFAVDTTGGTSQVNKSLTLESVGPFLQLGAIIYDNDCGAGNYKDVYYDVNTGAGDFTVNALGQIGQVEPWLDGDTGDILGAGKVIVGGTANFIGNGNDINLDQPGNDFATVTASGVNNLALVEENSVILGDCGVESTFSLIAKGTITGSGALVGDSLSFRTLKDGGAAISLTNAANNVNYIDFSSRDASDSNDAAGALTYTDLDGVDITYLTTTGSATITAGDEVTGSGQILAGALNVKTKNDAGAAITLDNTSNDVTSVTLASRNAADTANAAGAITYIDANDFAVTSVKTTGTASLKAGDDTTGSVTLNGPVYAGTSFIEAGVSIINGAGAADNVITTGNADFKAHTGTAGTNLAKINVNLGGLLDVEAGGTDGAYSAYFYGCSSDNTAHLLADWPTPGTVKFDIASTSEPEETVPSPSLGFQNRRQAEAQTNPGTANEAPFFLGPVMNFLRNTLFTTPQLFLAVNGGEGPQS